MSLVWLLCLAALLLVPAALIYCGFIRQNICNNVGAKFGYDSALALSSPKAWAYAQKASVKRYIVSGVITGIAAIALMIPAMGVYTKGLLAYSATLLLFELLVWCILLITVESGLRKLLGIKES